MSLTKLTNQQGEIVRSRDVPLLAVTALAGTGKTTTLRAFAAHRRGHPTLYLTFNRSMANDAKNKFAYLGNVCVHTFHSLAYTHVGASRKVISDFTPKHAFDHMLPIRKNNYPAAKLLIQALNAFFTSAHDFRLFCHEFFLLNKKGLDAQGYGFNDFELELSSFWEACQDSAYPITHNGYLKLFELAKPVLNFEYILVDEAQDLSDCIVSLVLGMHGSKIFVGDPFQQIYGWNGAINALAKIRAAGANTYALTESFRVKRDLAKVANHYLQVISDEGIEFVGVGKGSDREDWAIIARTNAELFKFAATLPEDTRVHFLGGIQGYGLDILEALGNLVAGQKDRIKDNLIKRFGTLQELQGFAVQTGNEYLEAKIDFTLEFGPGLADSCKKIRSQATDKPSAADLNLTTIHKSKGQEFGRVVLLEDFLKLRDIIYEPKQGKRPKEVRKEELHLLYVGLTRAVQSVHYPEVFHLSAADVSEFRKIQSARKVVLV